MKGVTLVVQLHAWRGFGCDGGPLGSVLRLGFVSVGWLPMLLEAWFEQRIKALKEAIS